VKDTGAGVDENDFEKIFSAFEQASLRKTNEVASGTGLGLNICLLLIELMQGAISVRSNGANQGSKFTFWIPCGNPHEDHIMSNKEVTRTFLDSDSCAETSVLLVEDNAVNQIVIKGQLMKLGCQVDVASNGLIAAEMMKDKLQAKYDIILLDLEMPIKDGITTVTELREMGITTPIIALTAHAVEEKRTMALKAGMDDFLMKPCSIDTLKQCLDKYRHKFCK
jgi:CheY-like chemotaxis protein